MRRIIAVCLKEDLRIPIIGCVALNNEEKVDIICCIDEQHPSKVIEVTPSEFMESITASLKVADETDLEPEYEYLGFNYDKISLTNGVTTVIRNMKNITLFKKSYPAFYLGSYNGLNYVWCNNQYYSIKDKSKESLSSLITDKEEVTDVLRFQLSRTVYDILSDTQLEDNVHDAMLYMMNDLGMTREESQNFILETFNYTCKAKNIKMHRTKLKNILGLDAKGKSGKQMLSNMESTEELIPIEEEMESKSGSSIVDSMEGLENIEVIEPVLKDNKSVDIKDVIENTSKKTEESLQSYTDSVKNIVVVTSERDSSGEQKTVRTESNSVKQEIKESLDKVNYESGDPNCPYCKGLGYRIEEFFGTDMRVKCSCVDKYRELKASKEKSVKGLIKSGGSALLKNAMISGLIPRRRIDDVIDFRVMSDKVSAILAENSERLVSLAEYDSYKLAMRSVLSCLFTDKELDYSYLFSAPNGFSKTTFVYSCMKLLLQNGRKVVPYITLFELAQLRLDYMGDVTWRRGDKGYKTSTEKSIDKLASYNTLKMKGKPVKVEVDADEVEEIEEPKRFVDMTDKEKDVYIYETMSKNYKYMDYLNADVLFCQLSVAEQAYMEISTLKAILDYRGLKCKPTIILTDRDIEVYKTSVGMATDITLLSEMVTKEQKCATYDRAYLVSVRKERKRKLKVKVGETL